MYSFATLILHENILQVNSLYGFFEHDMINEILLQDYPDYIDSNNYKVPRNIEIVFLVPKKFEIRFSPKKKMT